MLIIVWERTKLTYTQTVNGAYNSARTYVPVANDDPGVRK